MIEITVENGVAEIVLDAPQRMNALDEAALAELQAAYERAAAGVESGEVRAVLLRGEGRGGADASAVADYQASDHLAHPLEGDPGRPPSNLTACP